MALPEEWEAAPEPGWVAPVLAEEFPGLGIASTVVACGSGRSPAALRERLRELSNRFHGSHAVMLRQRPIPWAYRVFFRHIGLDPDQTRTPVEQVALDRMHDGGFKSRGVLEDAITIATIESGVALTAFDADMLQGRLGLRLLEPGERFAGRRSAMPEGTIAIADESRSLAILFGKMAEGVEVGRRTKRTALVAIGLKGVPDIALEEALWLGASAMRA
ncbi:MAG: hypothetical protein EXQ70_05125 [Solirubrobacterales bacterium]|nr:hypothetical protein [Solirubrobacterales bacterium]